MNHEKTMAIPTNLPMADENKQPVTLKDFFVQQKHSIEALLPKMLANAGGVERLISIALTTVSRNPELLRCTRESVLGAVLQCASLGLEPNTALKQAYLVAFANNKNNTMECVLILGYQGLLELAFNSGKLLSVRAEVVRSGDKFDYAFGSKEFINHIRASQDDGEITHFYAYANLLNNGFIFDVWSTEKMRRHAERFAKSLKGDSPWNSDFEAMGKKTILKQVLNMVPKATNDKSIPIQSDGMINVIKDGSISIKETDA